MSGWVDGLWLYRSILPTNGPVEPFQNPMAVIWMLKQTRRANRVLALSAIPFDP